MLTINLQTVQKYLSKVGLLMVMSYSDTTHTLKKFYLLREKDWEKKFNVKDGTSQPRLPGLD